MDINTVRGISTFFVMAAFLAICWWAYSASRKDQFDEASNLPFDDDDIAERTIKRRRKKVMSNQQSSFWSLWISVIVMGSIIGSAWLLYATRKSQTTDSETEKPWAMPLMALKNMTTPPKMVVVYVCCYHHFRTGIRSSLSYSG